MANKPSTPEEFGDVICKGITEMMRGVVDEFALVELIEARDESIRREAKREEAGNG